MKNDILTYRNISICKWKVFSRTSVTSHSHSFWLVLECPYPLRIPNEVSNILTAASNWRTQSVFLLAVRRTQDILYQIMIPPTTTGNFQHFVRGNNLNECWQKEEIPTRCGHLSRNRMLDYPNVQNQGGIHFLYCSSLQKVDVPDFFRGGVLQIILFNHEKI